MSGSTSSVLGPGELQKIQDSLKQLDLAEGEVSLAMRAGLHELPGGEPIATAQAQIDKLRAQLLRIKNTYYPNSP